MFWLKFYKSNAHDIFFIYLLIYDIIFILLFIEKADNKKENMFFYEKFKLEKFK